jgi:hypothetical protein
MAGERKLGAILVATAAVAAAVASFANNLGGARNTVCSLPALDPSCVKWGLVASPALATDPDRAKNAVLAKVEGLWGNAAKVGAAACTVTLRYSVTQRGPDDFIVVQGRDGVREWESVGRVVSVGADSIFTRTLTPVEETGTQWELRLEADRLIQIDSKGTPTPLVKCGG